MNMNQLVSTKTALLKSLHDLERINPKCNNCTNYANTRCAKFDASPPREWIAGPVECEHWDFDGVPF